MITELKFKPDFPRSAERFEQWWNHEVIDRPPVTLRVRPRRQIRPVPAPATVREHWTRIDYVLDCAIARMEATDYVGDSFPALCPTLGPDVTATLLGGDLLFDEHGTSTQPIIEEPRQWERITRSQPRFHSRYWRALEELTAAAVREADNRYIVGIADLRWTFDLLAAVRDPESLRLDMLQSPALIRRAARQATRASIGCFERLYSKIAESGMGMTSWIPMYHRGPAYAVRCDFWTDSPSAIVRELIIGEIARALEPLDRAIFQVRGVGALRHLDMLLELPQIHAIQWEYGPGNGPAMRWIDIYRRCLAAGKAVQVIATDPHDALATLDALGAAGVWLYVDQPFGSVHHANAFLDDVQARCRVSV